GKHATSIHMVVQGKTNLLEVVRALGPVRRLADFLHRRQEQADEDGDDGDHHQQLDQRERSVRRPVGFGVATCHESRPPRRRNGEFKSRKGSRPGKGITASPLRLAAFHYAPKSRKPTNRTAEKRDAL